MSDGGRQEEEEHKQKERKSKGIRESASHNILKQQ